MAVTYRNTLTGRVAELAQPSKAMDRSRRWQRMESEPKLDEQPGSGGVYDPAEHGVHEVNDYLSGAGLEERERVLATEARGKGRTTILNGPYAD